MQRERITPHFGTSQFEPHLRYSKDLYQPASDTKQSNRDTKCQVCHTGSTKKSTRSGKNLHIVSVLRQEEEYMVKYTPLPEGVPEGEARGNS